jgi:hypothetical protein
MCDCSSIHLRKIFFLRSIEMDRDADPEHLVGYYYTERKTSGDMDVRRTSRGIG